MHSGWEQKTLRGSSPIDSVPGRIRQSFTKWVLLGACYRGKRRDEGSEMKYLPQVKTHFPDARAQWIGTKGLTGRVLKGKCLPQLKTHFPDASTQASAQREIALTNQNPFPGSPCTMDRNTTEEVQWCGSGNAVESSTGTILREHLWAFPPGKRFRITASRGPLHNNTIYRKRG